MEFFFILLVICLSPILLILIIVAMAYFSRRNKRKRLLENIPSTAKIKASVRINSAKFHSRVMKFQGFQCSGILYIDGENIVVEGFKKEKLIFNMRQTRLLWEGTDFIKGGLMQWFGIESPTIGRYFINIETGILVLELGNKQSTQSLYNMLRQEQALILQTPPPVKI